MQRVAKWIGIITVAAAVSSCNPLSHGFIRADGSCTHVERIDFKNGSIRIASLGNVRFVDGTGHASGDDEGGAAGDRRVAVVRDRLLRPAPSAALRMVVFRANRPADGEEWEAVAVYACKDRETRTIFEERYSHGVEVKVMTDALLRFTHAERNEDDPTCCTSVERVSTYRWDPGKETYLLIDNTARNRKNYK